VSQCADGPEEERLMSKATVARIMLRISVAALLVAFCHLVYHYVVFSAVTVQFSWF